MDSEFSRIFELYKDDVYRLAYSYTLSSFDSKDILQETFIRFYKNMASLPKNDLQIKKWLMKVASNKAKDHLKSWWHIRVRLFDEDIKNYCFSDVDETLLNSLNKISSKYRITIYLYYYEGYNISEVAGILSISESAVKARLSCAKEKIKKEMEW